MTKTVKVRRWDEEAGFHRMRDEAWPTAVSEPDGSAARVEGPGWVLRLEGDLPPELARRIVEAAADAIRFPTDPASCETVAPSA